MKEASRHLESAMPEAEKFSSFSPRDLSLVHELCDPDEKFAIERINLTSSTGFMVVLV
ncbi:hypothetical protein QUA70_20265 [Microcoleus sp. LAD1_D5]|uniref:hypothetical protein n=1 Tax=unclassified Microcoleus TaxID=2642155 RepID=UPI002FCEAEDE